ncbi:histone H3-like centromeric protein cid [Drosophila biarmipes]|uniref:histone H3-like centromeric protein cid n=1 Tax=Drosophila biarmipes TaxID=125945 RepID=UPI0007E6B4E0|nr:histone H3-like centromeric protein cid [Drosophila biarmipes]XP_050743372.1 histone H3-like centromeric protein cid [Drosophila biarmipes]
MLGDTNAGSDDDTAFRSPEPEDGTDYGLEFTTSRLTLNSNRRCSTLHKETSGGPGSRAAGRTFSDEEDQENRTPASSPGTRRMSGQQERRLAPSQPSRTQAAANGSIGAQNQTRRRKMAKPLSRARRMDVEILHLQNHPGVLIPKLPFSRLVREFIIKYSDGSPMRITEGALTAMQVSSELYLTQRLADSYMLTKHRNRVTLEVRDMALMGFLCDGTHC